MNWLKENPFISGLIAVAVVATGALVFLLTQSMTRFQETSDAYTQAVQKLHSLQNKVPFPNAENLEKTKKLEAAYQGELKQLRETLQAMEIPIVPNVSPQGFQDDLRTAVNRIAEKAAASGVELPENFYLGFSQYKDSPPSNSAAPALARQLKVIDKLVSDLIDFKIQSIDSLDRQPLPEEGGSPAAATAPGQPKKAGLQRFPLNLGYTAEQGKFRVAFNSLLNSDQFFIVRAINIQNTSPAGPPVAQADATGGAAAPGDAAKSNDLNVILGRESVRVSLRLEMITFSEPAEAKK
jgi:hypothetical protein